VNIVVLLVLHGQFNAYQYLNPAVAASLLSFWQCCQDIVVRDGNAM
jgi:hypothetical protein